MATIEYHVGPRGTPGYTITYTSPTGVPYRMVIPAFVQVDSSGNEVTPTTGAQLPASLGQKAMAASLPVVIASDQTAVPVVGNVASAAANSGAPVKGGAKVDPTFLGLTINTINDLLMGSGGDLRVSACASTNLGDASNGVGINIPLGRDGVGRLGGVGIWLWNGSFYDRAKKPSSASRLLSSAATTNATSVKGSAGDLFKISGNNTVASKRYLKLYNKASAPTVGTDSPVLTFVLAASAPFTIDLGSTGHYFVTGIAYAITGAAADADTTAIASGDIECLNLTYA